MIHDVVGRAAHEELDRPGPRWLAFGVVRADGIEVCLPMRREAVRGQDDLDRRPDLDLARELVRLGAVYVADDLVATPPAAARSRAELLGHVRCDVVEGSPAGAQQVEAPLQVGRS